MRPPLLLTGGPAAGKTAVAHHLAAIGPITAAIDVDDLRHLVAVGHTAPWEEPEGLRQQRMGVENAADLALRFLGAGIDVVVADVAGGSTRPLCRRRLPHLLVVRLRIELFEAQRRARLRLAYLTAHEFADLHHRRPAASCSSTTSST